MKSHKNAVKLFYLYELSKKLCPQSLQEYFVTEAYFQNNSFFGKGDKATLQRYAWLYNISAPVQTQPPSGLSMTWDQIFGSEFLLE